VVCGICLFELLYSDMKHIIIRRPGPYGHHLLPSSIVVVCLFKHFYTEMLLDRLSAMQYYKVSMYWLP